MIKTKVVIAGGTGFVGQGIIQQLDPTQYDVHSLSRHVHQPTADDKTIYHVIDLSDTPNLSAIIQDADWVIDAVGILLPNPIKKQNYQNSSYMPAKYLIDALLTAPNTKLLFISANGGPFFMAPYLKAKRAVETRMRTLLPERTYIVYPGIIFDKTRLSSYFPGRILSRLGGIQYFKKLRPISRQAFAIEIAQILSGTSSTLEKRLD
ncbi:SDR family oxidoreductase [Leuconostoc lactis]|uniref:SDR family oxidoreductase n=1 Tax=Leuconostoc lactis TaxID=1246 RepID=UPI00020D9D3F|nr:NAD-dependent epimerase/dehydratase family protein [Leuconostoc lactis]